MPRRIPQVAHWHTPDTQAELVTHATKTDLTAGQVRVQIGAVPLFSENRGALQQAIRLRVDGIGNGQSLTASISPGAASETVLDQVIVGGDGDGTSVHLFVPEVSSETPFQLRITVGDESAETELIVGPQRKWDIHLVHHSHFDLGYTDPQGVVLEHQLRYLDAALDIIAQTDDWDDDAAFRWNVEVLYPLQKWMATRTKAMRD